MILDIISDLLTTVDTVLTTIKNLFDNIKVFINDIFSIFPAEINVVLVSAFTVLLALYIYRLVR